MGNTYSIKGEKYKTADLPELLACVKDESVLSFLKEHKLLLPRATRISALKDALKETLLAEREKANKIIEADKNNVDINISKRAERLNWFEKFCETQLENELTDLNNPDLNKRYFISLWTNVLKEIKKQGVEKETIEKFVEENLDHTKDLPNPKAFDKTLNHFFFDKEGTLDGLSINQFKETILFSSSVKELDMIAAKYDVKIPKNLKRDQVQEAIILELKKKGTYNDENHKVLDTYTTKQLEEFAAANDLIASRYISKPQAIDYLLRNAHTTKDVFELELVVSPEPVVNETSEPEVIQEVEKPVKKVKEKEVKPTVAEEAIEETEETQEPNWTTKTEKSKVETFKKFIKGIKKPKKVEIKEETPVQTYEGDKLDLILRELQLNNQYLKTLLKHKVPLRVKQVIVLLLLLAVGFGGFVVFTYFYRDVFLFGPIARLLNKIPFFLNRGLMDFFYRLFEILILRR